MVALEQHFTENVRIAELYVKPTKRELLTAAL